MAKSPRPAPAVAPTLSSEALEQMGVRNYFADLATTETATESLSTTLGATATPSVHGVLMSSDCPQDTTAIYKTADGTYRVYFHISELTTAWWGSNLSAFTRWAMALKDTDTVYLYQTGNVYCLPHIYQILVVLSTQCRAKTIFVVDHIIETPLILLVADELAIASTGAITFTKCIPDDRVAKAEQIFFPYLRKLYAKAVKRGLLSAEEAKMVLDDSAIVFKTARQLQAAQVSA